MAIAVLTSFEIWQLLYLLLLKYGNALFAFKKPQVQGKKNLL
jgi:hypothetical protein